MNLSRTSSITSIMANAITAAFVKSALKVYYALFDSDATLNIYTSDVGEWNDIPLLVAKTGLPLPKPVSYSNGMEIFVVTGGIVVVYIDDSNLLQVVRFSPTGVFVDITEAGSVNFISSFGARKINSAIYVWSGTSALKIADDAALTTITLPGYTFGMVKLGTKYYIGYKVGLAGYIRTYSDEFITQTAELQIFTHDGSADPSLMIVSSTKLLYLNTAGTSWYLFDATMGTKTAMNQPVWAATDCIRIQNVDATTDIASLTASGYHQYSNLRIITGLDTQGRLLVDLPFTPEYITHGSDAYFIFNGNICYIIFTLSREGTPMIMIYGSEVVNSSTGSTGSLFGGNNMLLILLAVGAIIVYFVTREKKEKGK